MRSIWRLAILACLGIVEVVKLIPPEIMAEHRAAAAGAGA
jgi:hypothetical protein